MKISPPMYVYKYFPAERKEFFNNVSVRFTQPKSLNDPFEMRPHIYGYGFPEEEHQFVSDRWERELHLTYERLVREKGPLISFAEFRKNVGEESRSAAIFEDTQMIRDPDIIYQMSEAIYKLTANVGILSVSEYADNLLMWAHYADSHKGFVVQFDVVATKFFDANEWVKVLEVKEEDKDSFLDTYGCLRKVKYQNERFSGYITNMGLEFLITKGEIWTHEGEWRMLLPLDLQEKQLEKDNLGFPIFLFSVPALAIGKVILGVNSNEELESEVRNACRRPEMGHVIIEKARIDSKEFKLHFDKA